MTQSTTRRAVLVAGLPTLLAAAVDPQNKAAATRTPSSKKPTPLPAVGEFVRFADATTESTVVRLTNPASASYLPASGNRFLSVRERFLIFSSDRTGRATPFYLDLRSGELRPLATTANLIPASLCLDAPGRSVYLLDGTDLKRVALSSKKTDLLSQGVSAFSLGASPSELLLVRDGRLEEWNGKAGVLASEVAPWCAVRPGGRGCAFSRNVSPDAQEFWYAPVPAWSGAEPVLLAKGRITNPLWSPDGKSLMFLRQVPGNGMFLAEIHEAYPETGIEQRITATSQFAVFAPNGNGSVFVGASGSRAQPTIIILLRSTRRELTLCEHRATHPASVCPVFSPDSRRVYFQSDHQGKSALYSVNVELLVEPTPGATL